MSDKTATERLRELLDERGVEYDRAATINGGTVATFWYDRGGNSCSAIEGADDIPDDIPDGKVCMQVYVTPEQAIAATLGDADATRERHGDADVAAENAKLRELATKMARALGVGSDWCDRDCLAEFGCTDSCPIADAMHEMGIKEVRDD